jgi:ribosome-associated toxin RatA of RatAB toxin-antitoxin module
MRMREVKRSALVALPPGRMYALINDIESYPSFVPWCTHARIESKSETEIVATLGIKRGPLHAEFTTRNVLEPERSVVMHLVRGSAFKTLEGEWKLTPIAETGSRIELTMRFAFANRLSGLVFEPMFEETAASLVDAFVKRAKALDV